jgi:LPS export ABC transporter protein LptC
MTEDFVLTGVLFSKPMCRLLYLFLPILLFASCENDIQTVKNITMKTELPVRTAKSTELIYSDSAVVKVKLTAPVLDQYLGENPRIVMPKGVKVLFYNDSIKVTTQLTADSAIRKEKTNIMEAYRNVVVVNRKGEKLHTEKLIWDERKRIIYTNVHVLITTADDEILEGDGMEANEDFTKYKIKKPHGDHAVKED